MEPLEQARRYARAHRRRFLAELQEFVRYPSLSASPSHAAAVRACAGWLEGHLQRIGLAHTRVIQTNGHPLVWAEWRAAPGRPTLLIYGHYDVQPAGPAARWRTPPFEPVVAAGALYGRGTSDDKGPLFAHLKALESYLQTSGRLPINVICLFEGEEEIGSPSLRAFVRHSPQAIDADLAVISDTRFLAQGRPAIISSLRGSLGLELEVRGPPGELHSGSFGGAIHNPLQVLCELLASLHDQHGRISISGLYDQVRELNLAQRQALRATGPSDEQLLRQAHVAQGWGEQGYTLYERTTIRPSLTLSGIAGGYQGSGVKGSIPSSARAKLSFRLVPDQEPLIVERALCAHLARRAPPTVRLRLHRHQATRPVVLRLPRPALAAASTAYAEGFGARPVLLPSGGSIAAVSVLQQRGLPVLLMGFALPSDQMHAPNEHFHLEQFYGGITTCVRFLHELAIGLEVLSPGLRRSEVAL